MKSLKTFMKPFEAPQRSVKIKIKLNFYFNTTFRNARDVKGSEEFLDIQTRTLISHLFLLLHLLEKLLQVSVALRCILHFISQLSQDQNPAGIRSQVTKLFMC